MRIAIESATDAGSIAIGDGDILAGEVTIGVHARHAQMLLPGLDLLMRSAGIERSRISGIVVGAGPGSFTGVRIAGATARALARGLGVELFAWSSLAVLAEPVAAEQAVCTLLDARRGMVYAACYRREDGKLKTLLPPIVCSAEDVRQHVVAWNPLFTGDGARRYADVLRIDAPEPAWPQARSLLALAARQPDDGRVIDVSAWEPDYVRASGAERGIAG